MITSGNIITLCICLGLVILFRQLDKGNRSLEKIKRFTDKLKDDLSAFMKERMTVLEESSLAIDLKQTHANAAVKRLEGICENLAQKEAELIEKTKIVESLGKQIGQYDQSLSQLMQMTDAVEKNLSKITAESEFADTIGKKILSSKKQLDEVAALIPALSARFAQENEKSLSGIHTDILTKLSGTISNLETRTVEVSEQTTHLLENASMKFKDLYQKAFTEAAKKAESFEDAAFVKLKEQATERLLRYKEAVEEKSATLQEQLKEKINEVQILAKTFKQQWHTESNDYLEATRVEIKELQAYQSDSLAQLQSDLRSTTSLVNSRLEELNAQYHQIEASSDESLRAIESSIDTEISKIHQVLDSSIHQLKTTNDQKIIEFAKFETQKISELENQQSQKISEIDTLQSQKISELEAQQSQKISELEAQQSQKISELEAQQSQQFKAISEGYTVKISDLKTDTEGSVLLLSEKLDASVTNVVKQIEETISGVEKKITERIIKTESYTSDSMDSFLEKLDSFKTDAESKLHTFERFIPDAERLDENLLKALSDTEQRVRSDLEQFVIAQTEIQQNFATKISEEENSFTKNMRTLEAELNELKERAYDNVSSKLKLFEDEFFTDLAKRSDAITASLDSWRVTVDERLEALSSETESNRLSVEQAYTVELKDRLSSISDQYRQQTSKLEDQISSVETELRSRITASDQSILTFVEQFRAEFAQARESALHHAQNELTSHGLTVTDLLRKQERDIETRTKGFIETIENARSESEQILSSIRTDFTSWQQKNEQQLLEAKNILSERIDTFAQNTEASISDIETLYVDKYSEFNEKATANQKAIQDSIASLKHSVEITNAEFIKTSTESLANFKNSYNEMAQETSARIKEASVHSDTTIKSIKVAVSELRESIESTRDKIMSKLQGETNTLSLTLEEIDKKQKAFIAQTRVFDRAEELRSSLDSGIESLKSELSRLDVYRETMSSLEQQYQRVRKLEEEAGQKVSRFLAEKKRIDILETDFNKLLSLSDSIDKKMSEFTITNDDIQQYQIQIRRFEESIAEVNGRYERLEKKSLVLDQTVTGIDKAFDSLKELESSLYQYKKDLSLMPEELSSLRDTLTELLDNKKKMETSVEKLASLDSVLDDVEQRTKRLQVAREWLANTETRMQEINKESDEQLKLFKALIKEDGGIKKTKGAPPIGIRENVIKLTHQGWSVDEIARVLHLSKGEVELILELPQK